MSVPYAGIGIITLCLRNNYTIRIGQPYGRSNFFLVGLNVEHASRQIEQNRIEFYLHIFRRLGLVVCK